MNAVELRGGPHDGLLMSVSDFWLDLGVVLVVECEEHGLHCGGCEVAEFYPYFHDTGRGCGSYKVMVTP